MPGESIVVCKTATDTFELHCHGGPTASQRILDQLLRDGFELVSWSDVLSSTSSDTIANEATEDILRATSIRTAARGMGYVIDDMAAHGFRAMARRLLAGRLPGFSVDVVEAQLAHGKSGPLGAESDRAEFIAQRRALMSAWADFRNSAAFAW